jgi:hypothetical protein
MAWLRHMSTALLNHLVGVRTTSMHTCVRTLLALSPLLLTQCAGDVAGPATAEGGGANNNDPGGTTSVAALCTESAVPAPTPPRRLTKEQYINSIHDLLLRTLPVQGEALFQELRGTLGEVPDDRVDHKDRSYASSDDSVSHEHVGAYMAIGKEIGRRVGDNPERLRMFMDCRIGQPARACIDTFIQRFGAIVYRHTLSKDETDILTQAYAADDVNAAAVADVVAFGLNAPQFLYQLEYGDQEVRDKPGHYTLSGPELATRLALLFWQGPPDAELMRAAEAGELATDAGYEKTLDRMLEDKRAERGFRDFVISWLDLARLEPLDSRLQYARYRAFVRDDVPTASLREEMLNEVVDSFLYHLRRNDTYKDWFLSPYSFAKSDVLARLYHTPKWTGGTPPQFPAGERSGLITRAALLASASENTRPILKGVRIRERILCDRQKPPNPTNVNANDFTVSSAVVSTREAVENVTGKSDCMMCHVNINPLGFITENYDALGRLRTEQPLFDEEGRVVARRPINTKVISHVTESGDTRSLNNATELATTIADSEKAKQCFAEQYVRFTFGRVETQPADACVVARLSSVLNKGQSLRDTLKALAKLTEFRTKFIAAPR